ncbi:tandem-95 repeat protein [Peristeroidobacter soli]|uniref:tandem-95 repeat protein n=1 Tax=Peristeroidobacter soli TaxID=2497877 RepID=UPI00101CB5A8|nr:Ig-like domain-containing protein [Peristeroidobacter soli]
MNTMQDRGTEQRSIDNATAHDGGTRLRRLVRHLSRRHMAMVPMTLLLIGVSAAQDDSAPAPKQKDSSNDGAADDTKGDVTPQPGDKIALLAGTTRLAEHVLTKEEIAARKVRIAVRIKDDDAQATAEGEEAAAQNAEAQTNAAASEDDEDDGAIVMADGGASGGAVAVAPAAQSGDDDDSGLIWLLFGLGGAGAAVAIANRGDDDKQPAPPTEEPPPPPPTTITGEVIKGYVQGAAVYLDLDHDGLPDGDPVYTDGQGRFTFASDQTGASLLAFGGVDTLTNVPLDGLILRAPAGSTVISPLTTLIDEMMKQDDSLTVSGAQSRLATALGVTLPGGVNLTTFDPLQNLQSGGGAVEDQSESVLNTISSIQSLLVGAGAADAVTAANAAITAMAQSVLDGSLDLTSVDDVARVLETAFSGTGVGASNAADLTALASAIAAVNHTLVDASGVSDVALQVTRYALAGFQDLLTSVGAGAQISDQYERDISFSQNGELAAAIEALTSGDVSEVIDRNVDASISFAQRLEGDRFIFALNPELKLYQGAPDKIDTVTVKFDVAGVTVEREVRGANGALSIEVLQPAADGSYTLEYRELDKISIRPPVEFNGVLGAAISVHYVGLGVVESDTLGIAITAVNDAPTGQDSTVTTAENLPHVFSLADFPFTDAIDAAHAGGANDLDAIKIVSLPRAGTLYLGETAITSEDVANGFYVSASDIEAGLFRFVPATGENGDAYASFQFQVRDDGGTANGGVNLDPTAHTVTVNVASVNDAPVATDNSLILAEDESHAFSAQDFGFTDLEGNALAAVIITSLPEGGSLWYGEHQLSVDDLGEEGYSISAADLAAGMLTFVPDADTNGASSFDYRVQDNGGTLNGGVDVSETATFSIDITPVNDAPVSGGGSTSVLEDGGHTFSASDFGFNDIEDDSLAALIITSLPEGGTLWHGEHEITLDDLSGEGYSIAATDLQEGLLRFVPAANVNGDISFQFRLQDDGGTANGGVDTSTEATFTFEVTPVSDAPASSGGSATILEDGSHVFSLTDFGFSDLDGDTLSAVLIDSLPESGTLWYGEDQITIDDLGSSGYSISAEDIASGLLSFVPDADVNGSTSFNFRVQDNGGTANDGADISAAATFNFTITAVNDAPQASDSDTSILEDGSHTFSGSDFGFTDSEDHNLSAVIITSLPEGGTLWHGDHAITLDDLGTEGYSITVADLTDGQLVFQPNANANGSSTFGFRVQDDGGTENGGVDISETAQFTVSVTSVNDAPASIGGSETILEDGEHTFSATDFNFTDLEDNSLAAVIITSLPESGTLWHGDHAITLDDLGTDGYSISGADLSNGELVFRPDADVNGSTSFNFRVQDDGGTANGGDDTSAEATFSFDITAVNDAPGTSAGSTTIAEGGSYAFQTSDFGFSDIEDDAFAAVIIASLPESGTLWYGEHEITLDDLGTGGYSVSAADLVEGKLVFQPDTNANGNTSFNFRVQDDGGTANGGADISESSTFTVTITPVNDAPVATDSSTTILEDGEHTFAASDFGYNDIEDDDLAAVIITSLPEGGTLWHGEHEITLEDIGTDGYSISAADLSNGQLVFRPDANANGSSSFDFRVQDDGGTDNGGVDTSESATFTVNVTAVNDAPVTTGGSATMLEDNAHTFGTADFAFTDEESDGLQQLIIDSLPTGGTLCFNDQPLTSFEVGNDGYVISAEDLAAGKLVFVPDAGTSGTASFNFRLRDEGGTSNSGVDTSASATFNLTVTAVNDAPSTAAGSTTIAEGDSYTFVASDFSFNDVDGDELSAVLIDSLPGNGTLYYNNVAVESSDVTNGFSVSAADISSGLLRFVPADNQSGSVSFDFRVQDDGGTANGGVNSSTSATFTVTITEVNDAPVAGGNTVDLDEGQSVTLYATDFSYTDTEGNELAAVIITSLPENGTLYFNETALTLNDLGANGYSISAADLAAGKLVFTPNAGYNGSVSLDYQVRDDGGTAVGGTDLSNTATLTLDVSAVNDTPMLTLPTYSHEVGPEAAGSIFPVNTFTAGNQESPSITALADGGFVVVWMSKAQDDIDNSYGIYAQRFDASGAKIGEEMRVNQQIANDQFDPVVVAIPTGGFAVLWSSLDTVGGANLHSRAFDRDGEPLGMESTLETVGLGDQFQPSAAVSSTGTIATWTSDGQDGSGFGIYGVIQNGSNSSGEIRINTTTHFDQFDSQAVALSNGSYVVTWTGSDDTNSRGIFAQRISATGELLGEEFRINTTTQGDQVEASIAALSDGGFVVTWTSPDESGKGVYMQRYDANGVARGEQTLVNGNQDNDQYESAVTALPTGGFVVTWTSWGSVDSTLDIYAQRFGVNGEPLSEAVLVNSYTTYEQTSPAITVLSDGGIVITWQSNLQDGSAYGIYGQRFEPFAPNFIENGAAVLIAPTASVADAELDALNDGKGDWSGATLALGRAGGEGAIAFESDDIIDFISGNGYSLDDESGVISKDGHDIATVKVVNGIVLVHFGVESETTPPTSADVNYILRHFTYASDSENLPESVKLYYGVHDGNSGDQGSGGAGITSGRVTVHLTNINDAPEPESNSVTLAEDGAHTFASSDFAFTDAEDNDLQALIITSLPEHGSLTLNGQPVLVGDEIAASSVGSLLYTPNANYNGSDSFGYQLRDDGGTAHGGSDTSSAATMSISVTAVNDAPTLDLPAVASVDYVVNTTLDVVDANDGLLSLREAIELAANGQSIGFSEELLANGPITIELTDTLSITKAIYINGAPNGGAAQVELRTNGLFSAIHADVDGATGAILEGLVLSGDPYVQQSIGWDYEPGIYNEGRLTLANVTIKDYNQVGSRAYGTVVAALLNTGTLYVSDVHIEDNRATGWQATSADPGGSAHIVFNTGTIRATDFYIENNVVTGGNGTYANPGSAQIYVNVGGTFGPPILGEGDRANEFYAATNNYSAIGTASEWSNNPAQPANPPFVYQAPVIEATTSVNYVEGASGVQLSPTATLSDPDLDALNGGAGNWSGASITLQRSGTANSQDGFDFVDGNDLRFDAGTIYKMVGGEESVIGTYTSVNGVFTISFAASGAVVATTADANHVLQQITYSNSSNTPESSVELTYTVSDGNSGVQGPSGALTATGSLTVNIASVNDAPSTTGGSLTLDEGGSKYLSSSDFPFSDVDGNTLDAVIITSLPSHGTLTLNGQPVSANDVILVANLGSLRYTPSSNYNGSDSFGYQVRDNGGTTSGGVNTSSSATLSITVNAVNDAPAVNLVNGATASYTEGASAVQLASGVTLSDPELDALNDGAGNWSGASISLQRSDFSNSDDTFGFVNANDLRFDAGSIYKMVGSEESVIGTYSSLGGVLSINFSAAGSVVATSADADHVLQQVTYSNSSEDPDSSVQLTYTVTDGNSGSQGSGQSLSGTGTLTVNITAVNDAPETEDKIVTINEDQSYTFSSPDFAITDTEDDSLAAVVIDSLPNNGTLYYDGEAITSDQLTAGFEVSVADLSSGKLTFTPGENYYGSTSFDFSVRDNGGTANGGEDTSESATFTFDMRSVNDAPMLELPAVGYDYIVTTLLDRVDSEDGVLSLREALALAQDGQSIGFSDAIFDSDVRNIVLESALTIDSAVYINGARDGDRVTLVHNGAFVGAAVRISSDVGGDGAVVQGFNIAAVNAEILVNSGTDAAGVSNYGVATLADLTIDGIVVEALQTASVVGGIYNGSGATLYVSNVQLSYITTRGQDGGISANHGGDAALVWNDGALHVNGLRLEGNGTFGGDGATEGMWNGGDAYTFVNTGSVTGFGTVDFNFEESSQFFGGEGHGEGWPGDADDYRSTVSMSSPPEFEFTPPELGDGTPSVNYSRGDEPVLLAPEASLHDIELDALNGGSGNWSGATISVQRQGGADGADVFGHQTPESFMPPALVWQDNGTITKNGAVIATYSNVAGQLQLHFTGFGSNIPTTADVNELLRQITYSNNSASQSEVVIEYRISDGNASFHGLQGSGGEGVVTGAVTVHMETPPLGRLVSVSLEESELATAPNDGNTTESLLTYRVELPEVGAYEGCIVQLFMRGTDDPVATHALTAGDISQGWAALQPSILPDDGTYLISARLTDPLGTVQSELTAPFFTVVDRELPMAPLLDFSSLTLREDDASTGFVVSGTAEGSTSVQVVLLAPGYDPVGYLTTADANNRFHVTVNPTLFGDTSSISVIASVVDRADNASASAMATLTLVEAPQALSVSGTAANEAFSNLSDDAVVYEPGHNGGADYFIGTESSFDLVRIAGDASNYSITLLTGVARYNEQTQLEQLGHSLLEDQPLYFIHAWDESDGTALRIQAEAIEFDDTIVRLTDDAIVGTDRYDSTMGVTLHDGYGDERLVGGAGNDTLFGHSGNDILVGGGGDDVLSTVGGYDTLIGGDGDDLLVVFGNGESSGPGSGAELYGGLGHDVFMVAPQSGFSRDVVILDFVIGEDKIDLSWLRVMDGSIARELTVADLDLEQFNSDLHEQGDAMLDLGSFVSADGHTPITGSLVVDLAGGASTLTADDFILTAANSSMQGYELMYESYLMGLA